MPSTLNAEQLLSITKPGVDTYFPPKTIRFDWTQKIEPYELTAEECLVKFYRTMEINALANLIGCHRNALMRKAKRLNLGSRNQFKTSGTPYKDELKTLINMYSSGKCHKCIAKRVNRPEGGVKKKIARLIQSGDLARTTSPICCKP